MLPSLQLNLRKRLGTCLLPKTTLPFRSIASSTALNNAVCDLEEHEIGRMQTPLCAKGGAMPLPSALGLTQRVSLAVDSGKDPSFGLAPWKATSYHAIFCAYQDFCIRNNLVKTNSQATDHLMAACEDPDTLNAVERRGILHPEAQTSQMHMEYYAMADGVLEEVRVDLPGTLGFFCETLSRRLERFPVEGRHLDAFFQIEAELLCRFEEMLRFQCKMLAHLSIIDHPDDVVQITYFDALRLLKKGRHELLDNDDEHNLAALVNPKRLVYQLTHFPEATHPYPNMARDVFPEHKLTEIFGGMDSTKTDTDGGEAVAVKCDVMIPAFGGRVMETIGSAERETRSDVMLDRFHAIDDGKFMQNLYDIFGRCRVDFELADFLKLKFVERSGFGIGGSRMCHAFDWRHRPKSEGGTGHRPMPRNDLADGMW